MDLHDVTPGIRRREILQAAGWAALTSASVARHVLGANDRVNLAFIGVGRRGSANVRHAAQIPGFRIVAVCDLDPPALDEILADRSYDAVCIRAPGHLQPNLTVRACQSGKDVYVETPVFVKIETGPPIVEAARQFQRVVQAGTVLRSGTAFRRAREIVGSGELGDIAFCRVTGADDPMPLIDLMQFLFDEAAPVSAPFSIDAQVGAGPVDVTFRYPAFIASYQSLPGPWNLSIHGTRATLALNRAGYSLFPGDHRRPALEQRRDPPHGAHWKNFLECIRNRRRPAGDIETCVRSTTACLRASLAMRHNWVRA